MLKCACTAIAALMAFSNASAGATATPIHQIQGNGIASPFSGQLVTVEGVVTGIVGNGFFLQAPDAERDGDDNTSEGIFIHTGMRPGGPVVVGNRVAATGVIEEFIAGPMQLPLTRMTGEVSLALVDAGVELPEPVALPQSRFEPGADVEVGEPWEGMRVLAPVLGVVGAGEGTFDPVTGLAPPNGVFHATIAQTIQYPFREAGIHLLDPESIPAGKTPPIWDMNAEILRVDSTALGGTLRDPDVGSESWISVVAIMHYDGGRYTLLPEPGELGQQMFGTGRISSRVSRSDASELTVARVDVGGLWDQADDPERDDPQVPTEVLEQRLIKLNRVICEWLGVPDIVVLAGVESQAALDGLVNWIDTRGFGENWCNSGYVGTLHEGTSSDGLDMAVLVRTRYEDARRGSLEGSGQLGADAKLQAPDGSLSPLFARPPQLHRVKVDGPYSGSVVELSVLSVDIEPIESTLSLSPAEHGWQTVRREATERRRAQSRWLTQWLEARQTALPDEALVVLGGFEASSLSDGRVDVLGAISGNEAPASEVLWPVGETLSRPLTSIRRDNLPYWDATTLLEGSASRLDHVLVNDAAVDQFPMWTQNVNLVRIFPASSVSRQFPPIGFSTHEPVFLRLLAPQLLYSDLSVRQETEISATPTLPYSGSIRVRNLGPTIAYFVVAEVQTNLDAEEYSIGSSWPSWTCDPPQAQNKGSRVLCYADYMVGSATLDFVVPPNAALEDRTVKFTTTMYGTSPDPNPKNDSADYVINYDSDTDLVLSIVHHDQEPLPGEEARFGAWVDNPSGNSPGEVTMTFDINAPVSEVRQLQGAPAVACNGSELTGGSRWTCVTETGTEANAGHMALAVATDAADAGRLITIHGTVVSTVKDSDPTSNSASDSVRVGGWQFDASSRITAKQSLAARRPSNIDIAAVLEGAAPTAKPMRLKVTVTSRLPANAIAIRTTEMSCSESWTQTAVVFNCVPSNNQAATRSLQLNVEPSFSQGNSDTIRIETDYHYSDYRDSKASNDTARIELPVSGSRTHSLTAEGRRIPLKPRQSRPATPPPPER
jgi:hypothetical protein